MGDRHKRRHDSEEEEDFIGFDDSDGGEIQDSSFYNKRVRKVKEEDSSIVYDMQSEEEFIALYQNWDSVDKDCFPKPGALGLPFEFGWKRELVFRATTGVSKEKGDVYYITPMGRKLRTRNEIQSNLTNGLTMDNFSLSKVPLYLGPEYEIVRSAKMKTTVKVPSPREISPLLGKRIPKPKAPKGASPTHTPNVSGTPTPRALHSKKPLTPYAVVAKTLGSGPSTPVSSQKRMTVQLHQSPQQIKVQAKPQTVKLVTTQHKVLVQQPKAVPQNGRGGAVSSAQVPANFFRTTAMGYDVLLNVFQCLTVKELLRASRVCRLFNYTASHPFLWRTVRMKNSPVNDWAGFARALRANGTRHLDMRKMLLSGGGGSVDDQWQAFVDNIATVEQLQGLDLCGRCPPSVVEALYTHARQLRVLNGQALRETEEGLSFAEIEYLTELEELRLRPENWMNIRGELDPLSALPNLRHLSLTMFLGLNEEERHVSALAHLVNLESLELGECTNMIAELAEQVLPNLTQLRRLRLEKGSAESVLMLQIASMPALEQLELINFDVNAEFNESLAQCSNIRRLLMIPTYLTQSATTNNLILSGLLSLGDSLRVFTWVVTQELLRVTELYREQDETIELIPIIKPVPGDDIEEDREKNDAMPEVEMVPLMRVQEILHMHLPDTFVTIVKEDLQRTWRLNIVDS